MLQADINAVGLKTSKNRIQEHLKKSLHKCREDMVRVP